MKDILPLDKASPYIRCIEILCPKTLRYVNVHGIEQIVNYSQETAEAGEAPGPRSGISEKIYHGQFFKRTTNLIKNGKALQAMSDQEMLT